MTPTNLLVKSLIVVVSTCLAQVAFCFQERGNNMNPVTITYIANEGVLIHSGKQQILIDAIHKEYYPQYLATDDKILQKMFAAEEPFDSIDLILVSHVHRDHFHAPTIAAYLEKMDHVRLFSTPQVADSVSEHLSKTSPAAEHIGRARYASGAESQYDYENISVTIFKIAHGSEKFSWIENTGHLIKISGKNILHVGDPAFGESDIRKMNLQEEKIDVAILPYWFLFDENGRDVIEKLIKPQHIIACHIPPARAEQAIDEISKIYPEATVFTEPMAEVAFE